MNNEEIIKIINELNQQIQQELNDYDNNFHFFILLFISSFKWDKSDEYNYETFHKIFNIIKNNKQIQALFAPSVDI